jgi:hypothetical protein
MPPLMPASDVADATGVALRNVASGVTLADAVAALGAADASTAEGGRMARSACATLALLLRRPEGAACCALSCVNCPQDGAQQAAASALGAEEALLRTLRAGAHSPGAAVYAAWALGALCTGGGRAAALAPATAAACVAALTDALNAHGRGAPAVALAVATALTALFGSAAARCAAAQCDTAAALFAAVQFAARCLPPPAQATAAAEEEHHPRLERLGDALITLLDATESADVRVVAEARGGAAVGTTLAALHGTLHAPHTAARFASVLALLCEASAEARRAALASATGVGTVAALCTLLNRAAELHLTAPVHALGVLLQHGDAPRVAPPARAAGALAAVIATLRAHPGDAQLAGSAMHCLYHLVQGAGVACARAARDAGAIPLITAVLETHEEALAPHWPMICACTLCVVTEGAYDDVSAPDALAVARVAMRVLRTHAHSETSLANAAILLYNTQRAPQRELARAHAAAIEPLTAALARHAASAQASVGLKSIAVLMSRATEREAVALAAAGGVAPAAVAAMRAHADDGQLQERACVVLAGLVRPQDASMRALVAAGAPAAIVAAMAAFPNRAELAAIGLRVLLAVVTFGTRGGEHAVAAGALEAAARVLRLDARAAHAAGVDVDVRASAVELLSGCCAGGAGAARAVARIPDVRALLADVARIAAASAPPQRAARVAATAALAAALTAALAAHDAAPAACAAAAACVRCAEQRREGGRCGLAACGARRRHEQPGKGLLRCSGCLTAAYCCGEHQREAWTAHKPACRAAAAAAQ